MNTTQQQYNDAINLLSHLILTKPKPVVGLLSKHRLVFNGVPNRAQLIDALVAKMKSGDEDFSEDLGKLLTVHIQHRGKEMLVLDANDFDSYSDDEEEDAFWGSLAKGAIGIVGKLFQKKKKRRDTSSSALLASQAAAKSQAQANQIRLDMQRQMMEQQKRLQEAYRLQLEKVKMEAAKQRREQEEKNRRKQTQFYIAGGAIAVVLFGGMLMAGSRQKGSPMSYMPPPNPTA